MMVERLGICMAGNQSCFLGYLMLQLARWPDGTYLEVGVGGGHTFAPVVRAIRNSANRDNWKALAVDIPDGWSFDKNTILEAMPDLDVSDGPWGDTGASLPGAAAVNSLVVHPRGVHGIDLGSWPAIRFAFIDGCHGAPCVKADFEYVEKFTVPGSIVAFHDVNEECQGVHMQPHCKTPIDARRALVDLGLLGDARKGWKLLHEVKEARHACAFFEMVA
jgi:hypothetical protein